MSEFTAYTNSARGDRIWIRAVCRTCVWAVILLGTVTVLAGLPGKAFAEARVQADFNGDGFDDLAIGVPQENIGNLEFVGAVNVIYGSANRLVSTGNQFWNQGSLGILDVAEPGDLFGFSLTSGDFNNDGFDDLAIGVPKENIGSIGGAGAVNVIYGSASRLTSTGNQFWNQDSPGILDAAEISDLFGRGLGK